jgi:hypothetical protein
MAMLILKIQTVAKMCLGCLIVGFSAGVLLTHIPEPQPVDRTPPPPATAPASVG